MYTYTVCPRCLDPFCIVSYQINGARLLGNIVYFVKSTQLTIDDKKQEALRIHVCIQKKYNWIAGEPPS